jgi:hypothetical protein
MKPHKINNGQKIVNFSIRKYRQMIALTLTYNCRNWIKNPLNYFCKTKYHISTFSLLIHALEIKIVEPTAAYNLCGMTGGRFLMPSHSHNVSLGGIG